MNSLTQHRLKEVLKYDPTTGAFTWRSPSCTRIKPGSSAASRSTDGRGYCRVMVDGKRYKAHRLAWLYMTGEWPTEQIDHINGIKSDNRFANLRDVDQSTNQENRRHARADSSTGMLGVFKHRDGFVSAIRVKGRLRYLGKFETEGEAVSEHLKAKRDLHAGCTI